MPNSTFPAYAVPAQSTDLSTNAYFSQPNDDAANTGIDIAEVFFDVSEILANKGIDSQNKLTTDNQIGESLGQNRDELSLRFQRIQQFPKSRQNKTISKPIAEWDGLVTDIEDEYLVAQLRGTFGMNVIGCDEEAFIPIEDVNQKDYDLLKIGAFFRLCISYEISPHGNRRRYTEVVFRRLPAYRREELEVARSDAAELARDIRVE